VVGPNTTPQNHCYSYYSYNPYKSNYTNLGRNTSKQRNILTKKGNDNGNVQSTPQSNRINNPLYYT